MVLVEVLQVLRIVGKFAVYFQAIWIAVAGLLLTPDELALCALPAGTVLPLRALEVGALAALYIMVASHLWPVAARCRAAAPLYAVATEDFISEPPLRSRPLYCGTLGLVEGTYAPTQMCDWDALHLAPSAAKLRWRDRYALRRCAEDLVAREAHLLSYLDALQVRIDEAELEAHGGASAMASPSPAASSLPRRLLNALFFLLAVAACAAVARGGWQHTAWPAQHEIAPASRRAGVVEATLWAALLLRVGHGWYSILLHSIQAWEAAGHDAYIEAADLRQRVCSVHRSLAEAQWLLGRVQAKLTGLGVACRHPGMPPRGGADQFSSMRALAVVWLVCACAPALLPRAW